MAYFPFMNKIFLFNTQNRPLLTGDIAHPQPITLSYAIRYFALIFFAVGLPMMLLISLLVMAAGYPVRFMLPIQLVITLGMSVYFTMRMFIKWRTLAQEGRILYGEIIHRETQPNFTLSNNIVTLLHYRIITPDNDHVGDRVSLTHPNQRMPDGRKYPDVGTRIAVLYASDQNHTLL